MNKHQAEKEDEIMPNGSVISNIFIYCQPVKV
jgi:hypothetical protein